MLSGGMHAVFSSSTRRTDDSLRLMRGPPVGLAEAESTKQPAAGDAGSFAAAADARLWARRERVEDWAWATCIVVAVNGRVAGR